MEHILDVWSNLGYYRQYVQFKHLSSTYKNRPDTCAMFYAMLSSLHTQLGTFSIMIAKKMHQRGGVRGSCTWAYIDFVNKEIDTKNGSNT